LFSKLLLYNSWTSTWINMEGEAEEVVVLKKSELLVEMEAAVPVQEARAAGGDLDGAIEALLLLEKRCRMVRASQLRCCFFLLAFICLP